MDLASSILQDDYDVICEPQHIHAANKCQTRILDENYRAADLPEIINGISTTDDIDKIIH
jgi:hypothetical protein